MAILNNVIPFTAFAVAQGQITGSPGRHPERDHAAFHRGPGAWVHAWMNG